MEELSGKTSDRIRKGEIPQDSLVYERQPEVAQPSAVRHGSGQGLGAGATRARNGGTSDA